ARARVTPSAKFVPASRRYAPSHQVGSRSGDAAVGTEAPLRTVGAAADRLPLTGVAEACTLGTTAPLRTVEAPTPAHCTFPLMLADGYSSGADPRAALYGVVIPVSGGGVPGVPNPAKAGTARELASAKAMSVARVFMTHLLAQRLQGSDENTMRTKTARRLQKPKLAGLEAGEVLLAMPDVENAAEVTSQAVNYGV